MMRSMFSAVSGLRVHQTKMDVIANNISNVNTAGFKASRVTFSEIFSQTISGASSANPITGRGGVNPRQIGLGASIASVDLLVTQGASQRTDKTTDLMIDGDAFFIVGDASGNYFTRDGTFDFDKAGNFINTSGLKVQGWEAVPDPDKPGQYMINKGPVQGITIGPDKRVLKPTTTKNVSLNGNLQPEDAKASGGVVRPMTFYDSIGNQYSVNVTFNYDDVGNKWSYKIDSKNVIRNNDTNDVVELAFSKTEGSLEFDNTGGLKSVEGADKNILTIAVTSGLKPESLFGSENNIKLDFNGITQHENQSSSLKLLDLDGNPPGTLEEISIGPDGKIMGRYTTGAPRLLAQIAVAKFENPSGLQKFGSNLFVTTANSGNFDGIGQEVQDGGGNMMSSALEMSNVDLSSEFTEMITTQRGFQANSRVITTSDDMLQELVNLKR